MSRDLFSTLEQTLLRKLEGLDRLIVLAGQNRDALVASDVDAIVLANEQQTSELSRLDRLQRSSARLLNELASSLGLEDRGATLKSVAAALPEQQRQRLAGLSEDLQNRAQQLAFAAELNATLSTNALDFIQFSLQTISRAVAEAQPERGVANPSLVLDVQA